MKKWYSLVVGGNKIKKLQSLLVFGVLSVMVFGGVLISSRSVSADTTASANASVTVTVSCTLSGGASGTGDAGEYTYSGNVTPGTTSTITGSKLSAVCNDANGYSIYAIGYSGDSYDAPTNTQMLGTDSNISTGTNTSGNSSWAMKVNPVSGSAPTITNNFNNFHVVPEDYTQVAKYTSSTASPTSTGAQVQTTYQIYANPAQAADTYTGKVKYTMVHPNDAPAPTPPPEMQNLAASQCTTTPTTVVDSRDGEEYLIQKLADGNCWMLDNLRLGGNSTIALTPSDTNITSNWTLPASTTTGFTDDTTGYTTAALNADYKNTTTTSYGAGSGKIGNYYNYCAVSAGTYCYAIDSGTGNAEHDICPAGWRMPTGASSGEYQALYTAYSSDATSFRNALSTPLSGRFVSGSASNQGSYGRFWSSTYNNGSSMYLLYVSSSSVYPTNRSNRYSGCSLRCILDS